MSNFKEMYNSFTNYINNTLGQRGGRLLLSMASICPNVSVLITGLWVQRGSKTKSAA